MTKTIFSDKELSNHFDASQVSPLVVLLASEELQRNSSRKVIGQLFEVGGGWCGQTRWQRSSGYVSIKDTIEPEEIKENWNHITDFSGNTINPSSTEAVSYTHLDVYKRQDLDSVSFNSDIEDAVQSTQSTKNPISPSFFSEKKLNNRLHQGQGKEALFRLVENEFPDKSLSDASSISHAKDVKIQETIRKLNRFKPIEESKTQRSSNVAEPGYGKFETMKKDKPKPINSEGVGLDTKHSNDPNGIVSGTKSAKFGKIKVKRKTDDAESKVIEFKRKRNMGNKSLKDIFANAGKTSNAASSIKVVKLTRDLVDDSKDNAEKIFNRMAQTQISPKVPVKESTPEEKKSGQAIPSSFERTPQFKKVKVCLLYTSRCV